MKKIICNPINLDYRYQVVKSMGIDKQMHSKPIYREGADPTVILFRDHYLMFVSMSGGFWYSEDLYDWQYKATPELPIYDYAPDVAVVAGAVIFSASKAGSPCTFFRSVDPINEAFEAVSSELEYWDPHTFQDEDGRVYFYWGCSSTEPLYGIELDCEKLTPIGEKIVILGENEAVNGWERSGENNVLAPPKDEMEAMIRQYVGTKPFIEGAFMNKHDGKYYFQYAGPGTQYNVYSDGVYIGDSPMGPFTYQTHNPFSSKPGGFITGAGHGSTFIDKYGNMWHASTMRISVNENFERRVGLFPCAIDADGVMHCNQHFADYPFYLPEAQVVDIDAIKPAFMHLAYNCETEVSSEVVGYEAKHAVDENVRTWWAAASRSTDEYLQIDLGCAKKVSVIQLNFADCELSAPHITDEDMVRTNISMRHIITESQKIAYVLEASVDGEAWTILKETKDGLAHELVVLEEEKNMRYVRVRKIVMPLGGMPAVSGLRVFGTGVGDLPNAVGAVQAERVEDGMTANLSWEPVAGADGYNVRYGVAPDKLYSSWQVTASALRLSMLTAGTTYYIRVDSFNESGLTTGEIFKV